MAGLDLKQMATPDVVLGGLFGVFVGAMLGDKYEKQVPGGVYGGGALGALAGAVAGRVLMGSGEAVAATPKAAPAPVEPPEPQVITRYVDVPADTSADTDPAVLALWDAAVARHAAEQNREASSRGLRVYRQPQVRADGIVVLGRVSAADVREANRERKIAADEAREAAARAREQGHLRREMARTGRTATEEVDVAVTQEELDAIREGQTVEFGEHGEAVLNLEDLGRYRDDDDGEAAGFSRRSVRQPAGRPRPSGSGPILVGRR